MQLPPPDAATAAAATTAAATAAAPAVPPAAAPTAAAPPSAAAPAAAKPGPSEDCGAPTLLGPAAAAGVAEEPSCSEPGDETEGVPDLVPDHPQGWQEVVRPCRRRGRRGGKKEVSLLFDY